MGENPTKLTDYYMPLTCTDSAGNEYICISQYEATEIVKLIELCRANPDVYKLIKHPNSHGDWSQDVPFKVHRWLDKRNDMLVTDPEPSDGKSNAPQDESDGA